MTSHPTLDLLLDGEPEEAWAGSTSDASWPRIKLVSTTFWVLLCATLAVPVIAAGPSALEGFLGVPVVLLAATAARWTVASPTVERGDRSGARIVLRAATSGVLGTFCVFVGLLAVGAGGTAPGVAGAVYGLVVLILALAAVVRRVELRYQRASRQVFLIATEEQRRDVVRESRSTGGIEIVGFFNASLGASTPADTLTAHLAERRATMVVLSREAAQQPHVCAAVQRFNLSGGRVRDLNGFYERHFHKIPLGELTPSWFLFDIAEIHRPWLYRIFKRIAETFVAGVVLLLLSPLLLLIAFSIRTTSRGGVLYRQERVGHHDRPFTVLKFRTMSVAAPGVAAAWAGAEVHRVTPIGRWLRRWRVDEIPQLVNVLLGQMSLVGPRPEQVPMVRQLEQQIEFYAARHSVRPGLTGWAQINHGYGGSRTGTLEKLQYDFFYIKRQSLRLDLLVLVSTARAILRGPEG